MNINGTALVIAKLHKLLSETAHSEHINDGSSLTRTQHQGPGVVVRTGWVDPRAGGGRNFGNNNLAARVIRMYMARSMYRSRRQVHNVLSRTYTHTHMLCSECNAYSRTHALRYHRGPITVTVWQRPRSNPPFHY